MQPQDGPPVLRAVVVAVGLGKSVLHGAFEIQNVSRGFGPIAL